MTVSNCANYHGFEYKLLHVGLLRGGEFEGCGKKLLVFTPEEEDMVVRHVLYKGPIGYGDSWNML